MFGRERAHRPVSTTLHRVMTGAVVVLGGLLVLLVVTSMVAALRG